MNHQEAAAAVSGILNHPVSTKLGTVPAGTSVSLVWNGSYLRPGPIINDQCHTFIASGYTTEGRYLSFLINEAALLSYITTLPRTPA